jgi:hypothetical protein
VRTIPLALACAYDKAICNPMTFPEPVARTAKGLGRVPAEEPLNGERKW